ncbi:MAG: hypothetical protein S4CHLAM20_00600 [Chlamydiia bacterium]|nr:hypothetical protein [Chlamydiia bacterium]
MKLFFLKRYLLASLFSLSFIFSNPSEWDLIYKKVNLKNPSNQDMELIQDYLHHGRRIYLRWLDFIWTDKDRSDGLRYDKRARRMHIWRGNRNDLLMRKIVYNTTRNDKDVCIITYGSFNKSYTDKIDLIDSRLKDINFKGHFLFRMGGWPDIEGGSLKYIHVPYSFKLCMIKEAMRLGYKKIVWIDTAVVPLENFLRVFEILDEDGYFLIDHTTLAKAHVTESVVKAFNLTTKEMNSINEIQASMMAFNTESEKAQNFIAECFSYLDSLDAYLSPRPEQVAMGIIGTRLGMKFRLPFVQVFRDDIPIEKADKSLFYLLKR